jgi:hypothetical protein
MAILFCTKTGGNRYVSKMIGGQDIDQDAKIGATRSSACAKCLPGRLDILPESLGRTWQIADTLTD